jgi:signal peptidase I
MRHRSYTEKVLASRKRRKSLLKFALVLLALAAFRTFLAQTYHIRGSLMAPALLPGDSVVSFPLPLGANTVFGKLPPLTKAVRGELLILSPPEALTETFWSRVQDTLARFFTLQRISPARAGRVPEDSTPMVVRVVGLPGDTLRLEKGQFRIRPAGRQEFASENSLSKTAYSIGKLPEWNASDYPVTWEWTVGAREYFVACDDRSVLSASLLQGPVPFSRISGRVIGVFWPFSRARIE